MVAVGTSNSYVSYPQYGIVLRRSQARPAERSTGPVMPSARQPVTSSTATPWVRSCQMTWPESMASYSLSFFGR